MSKSSSIIELIKNHYIIFTIIVLVILGLAIGLPLGLLLNKSSSSNAPAPIYQPIYNPTTRTKIGWFNLGLNTLEQDLSTLSDKDANGNDTNIMKLADNAYNYRWGYNPWIGKNYIVRNIPENDNNRDMLLALSNGPRHNGNDNYSVNQIYDTKTNNVLVYGEMTLY